MFAPETGGGFVERIATFFPSSANSLAREEIFSAATIST